MGVKNPEKHRTPFICRGSFSAAGSRNLYLRYENAVKCQSFTSFSKLETYVPRIYFTGYDALLANTRILLRSDKFKKINLYTIFSLKKGFAFVFGLDFRYYVLTCLSNFSCNLSKIDLCETVRLKTKFDSVVSLRIYRKDSNWYLLVPNFGSLQL